MEHTDFFATILDVRLSMVLKSAMAPAPETPKGMFKISARTIFSHLRLWIKFFASNAARIIMCVF